MKRKYFFIFAAMLICSLVNAQNNHYVYNYHDFAHKITVVAQINIDGVEQTSSDFEIGAFDGTNVTGSARIGEYGSNHYHRAYFAIFYNTAYDATFKLYNHATGEELDNCTITYQGDPLTFEWEDENGYGTTKRPVVFDFTTTASQTFAKVINPYDSDDGGYYFVASPIGTVSPEDVENMTSNTFDLYYFDQTKDLEWINYKAGEGATNPGFSLQPGIGYLYANSNQMTLSFTGVPYSGDGKVTLNKADDADWPGWNLVGNPFAQTAYINRAYYVMNGNGNEIIPSDRNDNHVEAMEGIFVIAEQDNEEMTFSTSQPEGRSQQLVVNVMQNRGASTGSATTSTGSVAIDRAIVRFGDGSLLPKFQLNPSHTKVCIPQGGQDLAVVHSEGIGDLPIKFKAESNGTYTLNFSNSEITFSYLHLIDNMTGADVDLLANPNYSFEANTADYASRFRLVFSANDANDDACEPNFAYFRNGNLIILNDGVATLQVVDMMGRILSSEQINGTKEMNLSPVSGVYMLRLINGNDVKTQKVVVKQMNK